MPCADYGCIVVLDSNGCPHKLKPVDGDSDGIVIYKDGVAQATDNPCITLQSINNPKYIIGAGGAGCWGFWTGPNEAGIVLWDGTQFYVNNTICLPALPQIVQGKVILQNENGCFSNFAPEVGIVVSDGTNQFITMKLEEFIDQELEINNLIVNNDLTVNGDVIFNGQLCMPNIQSGAIVSKVGLNAQGCFVKDAGLAPGELARVIKTAHDNGTNDLNFPNPGPVYVPVPNLVGDSTTSSLNFTNLGNTSYIRISYELRGRDCDTRIVLDGNIVFGLDQLRVGEAQQEYHSGSYEIQVNGVGNHTAQMLVRNNPDAMGPFNVKRAIFQIAGFASEIS